MLKLSTILISLVLSVLNIMGTPVQNSNQYNLTTYCYDGSTPIEGVDVLLYKVGSLSDSEILWDDKFIGIESPDLSSSKSVQDCAKSVSSRIQGSGYSPNFSTVSDKNGKSFFQDLDIGVYCVLSNSKIMDNTVYTAVPTLVLVYRDTVVELKATIIDLNPDSTSKEITVRKEWVLASNAKAVQVSVALLRNGVITDSVELNADNNWSYSWSNLDSQSVWSVSELSVPDGFVAELSESNNNFIIKNVSIDVFKVKPPTGVGSKSYMGYIVGSVLLFLLTVGIIVFVKKKEKS